jgi:hypothetical protein
MELQHSTYAITIRENILFGNRLVKIIQGLAERHDTL